MPSFDITPMAMSSQKMVIWQSFQLNQTLIELSCYNAIFVNVIDVEILVHVMGWTRLL